MSQITSLRDVDQNKTTAEEQRMMMMMMTGCNAL